MNPMNPTFTLVFPVEWDRKECERYLREHPSNLAFFGWIKWRCGSHWNFLLNTIWSHDKESGLNFRMFVEVIL